MKLMGLEFFSISQFAHYKDQGQRGRKGARSRERPRFLVSNLTASKGEIVFPAKKRRFSVLLSEKRTGTQDGVRSPGPKGPRGEEVKVALRFEGEAGRSQLPNLFDRVAW